MDAHNQHFDLLPHHQRMHQKFLLYSKKMFLKYFSKIFSNTIKVKATVVGFHVFIN
jgi:hypothetical protein